MTDLFPEPTYTIDPDRLAKLLAGEVKLDEGGHNDWEDGHCAMEVVSWLANLGFTDTPQCASHALGNAIMAFNDNTPDADRQRLIPILPRTVGTRDDGLDFQRKLIGSDYLARVGVPLILEHSGLTEEAGVLRGMDPITDDESMTRAFARLRSVLELVESDPYSPSFDSNEAQAIAHRVIYQGGYPVMVALSLGHHWELNGFLNVRLQRALVNHIHAMGPNLPGPRWTDPAFDYAAYCVEVNDRFLGELRGKLVDAALDMLTAAIKPGVEAPTPATEVTK